MQQFLVMKNQSNQNDLVQKYGKDTFTTPGFSKEQTNSILNISSQGGTNMSFINWNVKLNENRPKSKELKQLGEVPLEYSPKYPLKKGITHFKNYEKRLISGNIKNRKTTNAINSLSSHLAISKDTMAHPKAEGGYTLTGKNWHKGKVVDKWRTHDERNSDVLNLEPSTSGANSGEDYASYTMYKHDKGVPYSQQMGNLQMPVFTFQSTKPHSKPVVESNVAVQKYVKMVPNKQVARKSIKSKNIIKKGKNLEKSNIMLNKSNVINPKMIISPHQISKNIKKEKVFSLSPKGKPKDKYSEITSSKQEL